MDEGISPFRMSRSVFGPGEFFGIVGESGGGKSTVSGSLNGILSASVGKDFDQWR